VNVYCVQYQEKYRNSLDGVEKAVIVNKAMRRITEVMTERSEKFWMGQWNDDYNT
jgi:hypothetical protein